MYIEQKKIEKEGKVIELYLKGYTRRQIAKELKMSTRDVCRIINNYREKINPTREVSNTSKAFTMYSEGKGPTEAVIELDISPSDAENMYSDYLRLSDRQQVNAFYDELEERLPDLLSLHKIVKKYDRVENRKIIKKIPWYSWRGHCKSDDECRKKSKRKSSNISLAGNDRSAEVIINLT